MLSRFNSVAMARNVLPCEYAADNQVRDESDIAGEPVKAGNEKHGAVPAAFFQRGKELRPVGVASAAFNLCVLCYELAVVANVTGYGRALRIEAQSARALAVGADAIVSDV